MKLRPHLASLAALPVVSLVSLVSLGAFGCGPAAPAPVTVASLDQDKEVPVTEVNLSPPASPAAPPSSSAAAKADHDQAVKEAMEFGMVGLLNTGPGDDAGVPWGNEDSLGADPLSSVKGNMWGDSIGDAFGVGGLGLVGTGAGGGGTGQGTIGLGGLGSIGHGAGTGTGQGYGSGAGRLGGTHRSAPPKVRVGASSVSGRLPPEVIQRVVRRNFGQYRYCYEKGLAKNPTLTGRVSVRFVIGKDGATTQVSSAGSDLPSKEVVDCVLKAFERLSYPAPEGGVVVVVYPLMFEPGDTAPPPPAASAPKAPPPPATAQPKAPPAAAPKPPAKVPVDLDEP